MKPEQPKDPDPMDDYEDEKEFNPCAKCDGHPACEDYGCAYELGLGKMVKKDITRLGFVTTKNRPGYGDRNVWTDKYQTNKNFRIT